MIDSEIRQRTYQFFLEEAPELLQILETGLLNLKQKLSPALVHDLMRSAHSLKGGAATVGLDALAMIAHRLESILRGLYSDKVELDTELETWLLQAYDCLKEPLQQQINQGSFAEESALASADLVFSKIETRLGDVLKEAENYIPNSSDLGVDMVSSIFEVDVAQGIERLAMVLENPQKHEVEGELRVQAEVFAGFAEILGLPGFGEICLAINDAIDAHPDRILEIMSVALDNFQVARELVLAGDRQSGGSPSEALKALRSDTPQEQNQTTASTFESQLLTATPTILHEDSLDQSLDDLESFLSLSEIEDGSLDNLVTEGIFDCESEVFTKTETVTKTEVSATSSAIVSQPLLFKNPHSTKSSQQKTQIKSKTKFNSTANLKVKVNLDRLEKMNNLVGELVINRNSLALQQEHLQAIVRKVQQGLEQFQHLTTALTGLSDNTSINLSSTNSDSNLPPSTSPPIKNQLLNSDRLFDSLEMDSYGDQDSSIQTALEEMMQLEEAVEDLALFTRQSDQNIRQQEQILTKLSDELMWARMLPLENVLNHFPRALRDLSTQYQKPVSLEMKGTDILVDKGILEKLHDPLLHLIRNAFDHGVELPELRRQQGKSATGNITIHAAHQGNRTLIEISDDGQGLDLMKIAQRAVDKGWLSMAQLSQIDQEQLLNYIFEPGFSTADQVSELSGRGVGLDVVRSQLEAIKGTVLVDSSPGKGTTFTLSLPLTLTIAKLLVCSAGANLLALPLASIQEIIPTTSVQTKQIGTERILSWRDELLPVYRLSDLLEYRYPTLNNQNKTLANDSAMLIIPTEKSSFALEVEGFGTEQEMVIKPLARAVSQSDYVYGCTVMGDGNLIPAIDAVALLAHAKQQKESRSNNAVEPVINAYRNLSTTNVSIPTVLVVDDSAMMRKTLTLTLKKVGYRVLQARDGKEALELLLQNSTVDLIVSDLEMPRLNGFEFLNELRKKPLSSAIPVVMLTTRINDKHRQLALHLGASAYMSKPYIEQEFLDVLRTTVNREANIPALPYAA
ncbi:MAG: hybrid sensor histidine kinase/response regulator [Hyellaceae cyanobacterium CSU_1_1]|nr:hybrid sensor histidine kinase/response regulator [Hyellaceae cyanobacterium CSU_1_1]